jgi:Skp family chaperone for outer membrane proteins
MKFERLGWIVAAVLAGSMVGVGFQDKTEKTGSVDLHKVFDESDYAKKQTEVLRNMGTVRAGVLEFVHSNIHMKPDDAAKFRRLSLLEAPTAPDTADLQRLKSDAITNEGNFTTLQTKSNPGADVMAQIDEMNKHRDANNALLEQWNRDFTTEVQTKQENLRNDTLTRVKDAVQQVAKAQGYSIVFAQDVAPYSANDLTAEALVAMNKKK